MERVWVKLISKTTVFWLLPVLLDLEVVNYGPPPPGGGGGEPISMKPGKCSIFSLVFLKNPLAFLFAYDYDFRRKV